MRKGKKVMLTLLLIIIAFLATFLLWYLNQYKPVNSSSHFSLDCPEKGNTYAVAISVSPGNVHIKNEIKTGTYKKITDVLVKNTSSCPQIVKVTSPEPLLIKEKEITIDKNSELNLPLFIDVKPTYPDGNQQKFILFETITPSENQKIILKNNYSFKIVSNSFMGYITYHIEKKTIYYYIVIFIIILLILSLILFIILYFNFPIKYKQMNKELEINEHDTKIFTIVKTEQDNDKTS